MVECDKLDMVASLVADPSCASLTTLKKLPICDTSLYSNVTFKLTIKL